MGEWESSVGKSDDWYTPPEVFEALGCEFDLDVAGDIMAPAFCVPCRERIAGNSLDVPWHGFIWMNPPFGGRNAKMPWLDKFFEHRNGIALTPDRTSAPWFQAAWPRADLVMFTPKLKFNRRDGTPGDSPANGTALWACGGRAIEALHRARLRGFGILAEPQR